MEFRWSFFSLCLIYIASVVWGHSFNPEPLNTIRSPKAGDALPFCVTAETICEAFDEARRILTEKLSQEPKATAPVSVHEARHQVFQEGTNASRLSEFTQFEFEEATRIVVERFYLASDQITYGLAQYDLRPILPERVQRCQAQFNFTCNPWDRYRTFDGTCNNLRNPTWGMSSACLERLVDPAYANGVAEKRVARSGNPLPEPRRLSLELHSQFANPTESMTHMFMAFGQLLAHDITLTPQGQGLDGRIPDCCPFDPQDPGLNCDPLLPGRNDPFYRQFGTTCLSNARSAMCSTCALGPRQQMDQVTSYIDASHVYGLNATSARALRSNDGTGTLLFLDVADVGELPPGSFAPDEDQCSFQDNNLDCFETGDVRANQHPALTSLHVIFLREHNRIARRLREINPRWNEERLYQESRRIIGAEMQMIVYNEYLPQVLGPERMRYFDLYVQREDLYTDYDETVQATLHNEFVTAAFRFGHSMINSFFTDSPGSNQGNYLRDIFNYPFGMYRGQLEGLVEGLAESAAQRVDRYMVRDVTNHLYQNRGNESGLDLASLNINRGRDHGIPGYTTLVDFCRGPRIRQWSDLDRLFQDGLRPLFQNLYERVEDIDLFSGGLAEKPNAGAVVGPTFSCIIGIQFYHLKYGDRFYFEHGGQTGSFTPEQLREIKKTTLGKVICNNARIQEISANTFLYMSNRNPVERCTDKPDMDLRAWRDYSGVKC